MRIASLRQPGRRRRSFFAVALVAFLILAWWAAQTVWAGLLVQRNVTATLAALRDLQREPGNDAYLVSVGRSIEASARSLEALRGGLQPIAPLLEGMRPLPASVNWIGDVPDALAVAAPLARVGATVVHPFSEAAAAGDPNQGRLSRYLAAAGRLGSDAPEMARELEAIEAPLARLRERPMGGPLRQLQPVVERATPLLPAAREGLEMLGLIGPALGMEGPRTYLLLGQNDAEMRATGGFIGSVGAVTVENGAVARLEYTSSYTVDAGAAAPPAPAPLARYMGLGGWYLRDANWWPDFPSTAAQVELAWQRARKEPLDGVIAIDTATLRMLLGAAGTLEVPGYGQVSADSFERVAAEQLYSRAALSSAQAFHQAKGDFLGATGKALVDRLLNLSPAQALSIGEQLVGLLDTKHVQVAFKDQRLIQAARARGWDGVIPAVDGDSLYVVDTTVSYGDTYSYVQSGTMLTVQMGPQDDRQSHELVLDYFNLYPRGLPSWMPPAMVGGETFDRSTGKLAQTPGFWGGWIRVYLPPDADAIQVDGLTDPDPPAPELGRVVVAGYLPLAPGQRRTVNIRYLSNAGEEVNGRSYRLFLQKQAGLECRPISLVVLWPGRESEVYRDCLKGDQWVEVRGADTPDSNGTAK